MPLPDVPTPLPQELSSYPESLRKPPVLLAEDDADDRFLILRALREAPGFGAAYAVRDGEELIDYLQRRGPFADPKASPRPGLILLDLNMPRMGGLEALQAIKDDRYLRAIPIVVLTTSTLEEDILSSYDLGASAFLSKPVRYNELRRVVAGINRFWTGIAQLPNTDAPPE